MVWMASCSSLPSRFPLPLHHQSTQFPISTLNFSSGTLLFSTRGNHLPSRTRFHTYFARSDTDASQSSQSVQGDATSVATPSSSFLSVLCPLLKFFGGGDPSQERNEVFEVVTSSLSSFARLPWGSKSLVSNSYSEEPTRNPSPYLQLYEFEACPFCRRVREAMTELDLSAEVFPCPKGSLRHRTMVREIGGKEQFPFMIDLNTGVSLYESGDIVKYLFQQYGQGRQPSSGLLESTLLTGWVPTLLRAGRGMTIWDRAAKKPPEQKIELFSYENNPYARIVREALCELELPHIVHNVGQGSAKSELLVKLSGSKEAPYLVDPNTGVRMGDYKKILSYLFQEYSDK
ncbi:putative glutathione S-transferase, Thioredoxin-like superfamily [Dioscorea sansibarensis]